MVLRFTPPPQQQEPDFNQQYVDPALRIVSALQGFRSNQNDQKYRQFQMDMMKAKEERERGAHMYEYGNPETPITTPGGYTQADPRLNLYQPATMGGETQFGNITGGGQPESFAPRAPEAPASPGMRGMGVDPSQGGGLVDRFRQWQTTKQANANGPDMNQDLTDEQLFSPGMGAKRREDYLRTRKSRMDEKEGERKGRETEADIKLKGAQADYYKNYKGKTGRYTGWTPQSLETRKRNLLAQLRVAPLAEREDIMGDISEIDDIQGATLRNYGGASAAGGTPGAGPKPLLGRNPRGGGAPPKFKPGQMAINPQTKERLLFNGAAWVPAPVGHP